MKKLMIAAISSALVISAFAQNVAKVTIAGVETEYTDLREALVAGSAEGSVVDLIAHVDLENKQWTPIEKFKGLFDGHGYTISNLSVNVASGNGGLFGTIENGHAASGKTTPAYSVIIRNVNIVNASISAPTGRAGVLSASGANFCVISNITVSGSIRVVGYEYVSAMVGHGGYATLADCHVDGGSAASSTVTGAAKVGGIWGMAGEANSFSPSLFDSSVANLTIVSTASDDAKAGGLMGRHHAGEKVVNCSVENVIVKAKLDTTIGQIAGRFEPGGATQIGYVINTTATNVKLYNDATGEDVEIADKLFGDLTTQVVAVGTGVAGDLQPGTARFNFTAGSFKAYNDLAVTEPWGIKQQCATGYDAIYNESTGLYVITPVYAISWADSQNVVVSNGAEQVTGTSGNYVNGTVLKFYATVGEITNVTVNGSAATVANPFEYTVNGEAATIVVLAGETIQPIVPGSDPIPCDTPADATNAVEVINANKAKAIQVPAEAQATPAATEAYLNRVAAKVVDGNKVAVDIAAGAAGEDLFKEELADAVEAQATELTSATETQAAVTTVAGFYYWIDGGTDVGAIKTHGTAVMGDGTSQKLTKPAAVMGGTKAFFKVCVGVAQPK